ncbi:hypothetical protein ASC95_01200 [Pelomonas sp. Root1217]|uniref:Panacea domain-containing protein n=1 Tax=Pelomonas sp. Root1217 TaxID=1736430 RepID=UPI00070CCE91|nr:type II toxin-antitoxin system antitoxin SocA domain-containing protein [Pelomonas sp. Root1217]KQV60124.1 hypothetical protein ASC95_01200 [Pelomonas sp. Root1217]
MQTAADVARYFLSLADEEAGDTLSNLKLQKLLYYAQGFSLAIDDQPLFGERLEAWTHGPVVPDVYHLFKSYGSGPIPLPGDFDPMSLDAGTRELLDEVYEVYGQYSAWKLRNMTHDEDPWKDAYDEEPSSQIPHGALQRFFKTRLN